MNSFSFEEKDPSFTSLKSGLALRLLSKGLFYIRAMTQIITFFLIIDIAPAFTFSEERSSNGSPSVSIVFPDGFEDTLVLRKYHANEEDRIANEDHCNYLGHLANEPEACVAMTGCFGSEDVHFTILSVHAEESSMFMMTKDGNVEIIDSSFKVLTLTF